MIISLIGYRATGKSTVGKNLASELARPFYDSDQFITEAAGKSIAEIFSEQGEDEFRLLESEAVTKLMQMKDAVIAWGGGVVLKKTNRSEIRRSHRTIWLQASAENIFERMYADSNSQQSRPPLTDLGPMQEIQSNLEKRDKLYRECADLTIETNNLSVEEIVEQILNGLET